eukprot:Rhum_TRINITY_DN14847_c19_g1::Rhum_TRINITY_DN14847_c19_g1_i1::g.125783::m.125783
MATSQKWVSVPEKKPAAKNDVKDVKKGSAPIGGDRSRNNAPRRHDGVAAAIRSASGGRRGRDGPRGITGARKAPAAAQEEEPQESGPIVRAGAWSAASRGNLTYAEMIAKAAEKNAAAAAAAAAARKAKQAPAKAQQQQPT